MTEEILLETKKTADSLIPFKGTSKVPNFEKFWEYRLQDGFGISHIDIKTNEELKLEYEKDCPTLNFGFILSGNYSHQIKIPGFNGKELLAREGTSGIAYHPYQKGDLFIPAQTHISIVHIHLSLPVFYDFFHLDRQAVPTPLLPLLDGRIDDSWIFRTGMSMGVKSALNCLIKGPSHGTPAILFYQGIALDLMAEQIYRANSSRQAMGALSCDYIDRVLFARNILIQDLASPPCLRQLARETGMNINKLQQGFYQVYGVSVFKYLHQYRMQEAYRIFQETDMNVSQTASTVGYTNISHFSRAYKQCFNILPKKHLKEIKGYL